MDGDRGGGDRKDDGRPGAPGRQKACLWFVGEKQRSAWTEPLGARFREPDAARAIDGLFGARAWPESLEKTLVIWPGLEKRPPVPEHENLWFLPGCVPGERVSPRRRYLDELAKRGVPVHGDYAGAFRELFAARREPDKTVLLFPGTGHPRKAWPLVKYLELAVRLAARGFRPICVLGPVETQQGLRAPADCARPQSLAELTALLLRAAAVVGGDTGPLHLAAMLGAPTLSLFGPTDPAVWAPLGARVLAAKDACAPCAALAPAIGCAHGRCLAELTVDAVWTALAAMLGD
ncbi:MAG: glycosyltransferase family 9 protein [Desulfovibrionaceae bacterium]|nr:glycosyltransferase family 9 protein [Desulfovibrionaceae bacterium]